MSDSATISLKEHRARKNIPKVVRMLLSVTGLVARDLANGSGMTEPQVSERLNGKTEIKAVELAAWAEILDVDPGQFFRDPDELRKSVTGRNSAGQRATGTESTNQYKSTFTAGRFDGLRAVA